MDHIRMPPEEVRICIAEDNRINRRLIEKLLERLCYTNVVFYEDGKAALEGIRQHATEGEPFHIVFMDISMPVMGGMEATRLLREDLDAAVRDVPIIGMSPRSPGMVERLQGLGMQDAVAKPVRVHELTQMVEEYGNPLRLVVPEPEVDASTAGCEASHDSFSLRPHL